MRQMNTTGWMHNRLRMISASFLVKDLLINWREGEQYFMRQLIDGNFAANNGGWQWSASTGTDASPWFRIFNPTTQGKNSIPKVNLFASGSPNYSVCPINIFILLTNGRTARGLFSIIRSLSSIIVRRVK